MDPSITYSDTNNLEHSTDKPNQSGQSSIFSSKHPLWGGADTPDQLQSEDLQPGSQLGSFGAAEGLTGGWRCRMKRTAVGVRLSGDKRQQKNGDLQVEEVKSRRKIRVIKGGLLWFGHQLLQPEHLLLCSLSARTHARANSITKKSNSFFSLKCQWAHQLLPSILKQHN